MKRIISFSLYGDNPLYLKGAIENARIAKDLYVGWECNFFIASDIDRNTANKLLDLDCKLHYQTQKYTGTAMSLARPMYWRLLALNLPNFDCVIFRDCDSRLSDREFQAVSEWIDSDKDFHFIYDHPWHTVPIMGGMWGVKKRVISNIEVLIDEFFNQQKEKLLSYIEINDQVFLTKIIWQRLVNNNYLAHCDIDIPNLRQSFQIRTKPFPAHQPFYIPGERTTCFVGQAISVPDAKQKLNKRSLVG